MPPYNGRAKPIGCMTGIPTYKASTPPAWIAPSNRKPP